MGSMIQVRAADDTQIPVYVAEPTGARKGAVVVAQEIFGLNDFVRGDADAWAGDGYVVYAPDLFHRIEPGIELGYTPKDVERALELKEEAGWDRPLMDIVSCVATLRSDHPVGIVGYCYGGSLGWLAACRGYGMDAVVCYYGGQIASFLDEGEPRVPVQMHFGTVDDQVPPGDLKRIQDSCGSSDIHVYEGSHHGFSNRLKKDAYDEPAAKLARERSLAFLAEHLGS